MKTCFPRCCLSPNLQSHVEAHSTALHLGGDTLCGSVGGRLLCRWQQEQPEEFLTDVQIVSSREPIHFCLFIEVQHRDEAVLR